MLLKKKCREREQHFITSIEKNVERESEEHFSTSIEKKCRERGILRYPYIEKCREREEHFSTPIEKYLERDREGEREDNCFTRGSYIINIT